MKLRLPRVVYWLAGAAVACTGAIGARLIADQVPIDARIPIWLAGVIFVFAGLWILSLGTRSRLEQPADAEPRDSDERPPPA